MRGGNKRGSCKATVRSGVDLRGEDVQETPPFERCLLWLTSWTGLFCRGENFPRFRGRHSPEASMLKKAQLPAEGTGQKLCKSPCKFPTSQCQGPCMVKSKGLLLFLWIILTPGFSNLDLCMFRDGYSPGPIEAV